MTKEQAIEILRCNTDLGNGVIIENESTQSIYEALDMAIKALEQDVTDTNVGKIDSDCVSRASVKELFQEGCVMGMYDFLGIDDLPPVTITHGTCKDCKHRDSEDKMCDCGHTIQWQLPREDNWYCKDFEKRGNENGSN